MKKKILILVLMLALFVCVFAITASAAETTVDNENFTGGVIYKSTSNDFGTVNTVLDTSKVYYYNSTLDTTSRMVLKNSDGTYSTYPTIYVMYTVTDVQGPRWGFEKLSELAGEEYTIESVVRIEFPEGTNVVRGSSFTNCTNLVYVKIASTSSEIKGNAFQNCSNLAEVEFRLDYTKYPEFGSNLKSINNGAVFNNCTSLTRLVLPNSVTKVQTSAISGCTNLELFNPGASFTETNGQPIGAPKSIFVLSSTYKGNYKLFAYADASKASQPTSFSFYYTGSYAQALALRERETYVYEIKNATLISYDEFTSADFVRDETVHYFVYGYSECDAFYGGVHSMESVNSCVDQCSVCEKIVLKDEPQHVITTTYAYENGFSTSGTKTVCCANEGCPINEQAEVTEVSAIFEGFQYATRQENGTKCGMVLSYCVNTEALVAYETTMNTKVSYGVLAVAKANASDNILNADGTSSAQSIVSTDVTGTPSVDLIIWGDLYTWNTVIDGNAVKDMEFYIVGYAVENGSLDYFCGETTSSKLTELIAISYTSINLK